MRIGGNNTPAGQPAPPTTQRGPRHAASSPSSSESATATTLSSKLTSMGITVSEGDLARFTADLAALGLSADRLDRSTLLGAVLLHRSGLAIPPELLMAGADSGEPASLAALFGQARDMLAGGLVTGEARQALEVLVRDLAGVFNGDLPDYLPVLMREDQVDGWLQRLDQGVERALDAGFFRSPEAAAAAESVRTFVHLLAGSGSPMGMHTPAAAAIAELRDLIATLRSGATTWESAAGRVTSALTAALRGLSTGLSAQEQESLGALVADESRRLAAGLRFAGDLGALLGSVDGQDAGVRRFVGLLLRNGMAYEWQALAWMRSGKDPRRLDWLRHGDLKGILSGFTAALDSGGKKQSSRLSILRDQVEATLHGMTGRQIASALGGGVDNNPVSLAVPLGLTPNEGQVAVVVRRDDGGKRGERLPRTTVDLDMEASSLGRMHIRMLARGDALDIGFILTDEESVNRIGDGLDDLRERLAARGYRVERITCGKDEPRPGGTAEEPHPRVDMVG